MNFEKYSIEIGDFKPLIRLAVSGFDLKTIFNQEEYLVIKTKLFVSFVGALRQIRDGRVTVNDLSEGIFYLGTPRTEVFEPWAFPGNPLIDLVPDNYDLGLRLHGQLIAAIEAAEIVGRAEWNLAGSGEAYEKLDTLLQWNGRGTIFRTLTGSAITPGSTTVLGYHDVVRMVEQAGLQLTVVI